MRFLSRQLHQRAQPQRCCQAPVGCEPQTRSSFFPPPPPTLTHSFFVFPLTRTQASTTRCASTLPTPTWWGTPATWRPRAAAAPSSTAASRCGQRRAARRCRGCGPQAERGSGAPHAAPCCTTLPPPSGLEAAARGLSHQPLAPSMTSRTSMTSHTCSCSLHPVTATRAGAAGGGARGERPLPGHRRPRQRRRHGAGGPGAVQGPNGRLCGAGATRWRRWGKGGP